jgi:hypothetical protein
MNIGIQLKQAPSELTKVDKLAKYLCSLYDGKEVIDRKYVGVFSIPYTVYMNQPEANDGKTVEACFDEMIDGKPYIFGWRFWGKNAEVIYNFINNEKENG